MSGIVFDIDKAPPTHEQIESQRASLTAQKLALVNRKRKNKVRYIGLFVIIIISMCMHPLIPEVSFLHPDSVITIVLVSGVILMLATFYFFMTMTEKCMRNMLHLEKGLDELIELDLVYYNEAYNKYVKLAESYPELAQYQCQVAKQGRNPVKAEYSMVEACAEDIKAREKEQFLKLRIEKVCEKNNFTRPDAVGA